MIPQEGSYGKTGYEHLSTPELEAMSRTLPGRRPAQPYAAWLAEAEDNQRALEAGEGNPYATWLESPEAEVEWWYRRDLMTTLQAEGEFAARTGITPGSPIHLGLGPPGPIGGDMPVTGQPVTDGTNGVGLLPPPMVDMPGIAGPGFGVMVGSAGGPMEQAVAILRGSTQGQAFLSGLLRIVGVLTRVPSWVWPAVLAGTGLMTILNQLRGGSGVGPGGGGPVAPSVQSILQGPGIPEPRAGTYSKSWQISWGQPGLGNDGVTYFWRMLDGRIVYYSTSGKSGSYRPKKPIAVIMGGGATKLSQAVRGQRALDKLWRTVAKRTKQLKLA